MEKVFVRALKLDRFRNYQSLDLELDHRHVVLTGDNGAGKTNLLEALSLLSPGRGLRRAVYSDVVHHGQPEGFAVFAAVEGMAGPADIGTAAGGEPEPGTRRLRINAAPARSSEDLLDHLKVIWLTPAMDGLFTGAAGDRRRFLDRMVLSVDALHARRCSDYERAMRGRNRLLSEGRTDPVWLDAIEQQMAELGVAMALARRDFVALMQGVIARSQSEASLFPRADLSLQGFADEPDLLPATDLEAGLAEGLRNHRRRDQAAGRTLDGPHRSDLLIRHREKDMPAEFCSTGEQKALLTGLVLAHARLVGEMTGHAPLLLLDEIAAHLDAGRRAALFDLIDDLGGQAFMTGTDDHLFSALGARALRLKVSAGAILREENQF
jgi:DNA replication and repair protein RecF